MRLLVGVLVLIAMLTSACEGFAVTLSGAPGIQDRGEIRAAEAAASAQQPVVEEAGQEQAYLDVGGETLEMNAPIPLDPQVRHAELENGLTYYIRHNKEPSNRAALLLAVNAGSLQEDDDQLGLAHFLEHMLFNGTERFPKQGLVDYFNSVGMSFGADVNAFTAFEETVYLLEFPTDDQTIVDTTFKIAEDWASRATISEEEVDSERGVIVEEARLREQNAFGRVNSQLIPFLFGESRYADRLPIGDLDVVQNAPSEALRRFYRDWYRPDLMGVIVVGDIDVDAVERMIVEHFGGLQAPETVRPRLSYSLPDSAYTRYLVVTDPEYPQTTAQIFYSQPGEVLDSADAMRDQLVGKLFNQMLNFRFTEISRKTDSPFLGASVGEGKFLRGFDSHSVTVQARKGEVLLSLDAALTEVERVRRHGFAASELERAKSQMLNRYEQAYIERENLNSLSLAHDFRRHFLEKEAAPGIEFEYRLIERLLEGISREDLNRNAEKYVGESNRSVFVVGPERDGGSLPSEIELAAMIADVQAKQIDPYQDIEVVTAILSEIPEPAEIVSRQTDGTYNITDLTLENGARVLLKPTEFDEDLILFSALSPGGSSLVGDEDFPEADVIDEIVARSAVGDVSYASLRRLLADKPVGVGPFISEHVEGFGGSSNKEYIETLFQLTYLYGTAPNADEDAFATLKDVYLETLRNRDLSPNGAMIDAYRVARYGDSVRHSSPTEETISSLDLERAFEIYQERFADFSDFTFIFVGSFDLVQMIDLSQRYLGNLPSLNRSEAGRSLTPAPPEGIVEVPVYRGQEEQSVTSVTFAGLGEYTEEDRLHLRILEKVLELRMREVLREELGGTYSAGASAYVLSEPQNLYEFSLYFGSDPNRVEELVGRLFGIVHDVQVEGPREDLLNAAKRQIVRQREEELEQSFFWLRALEYMATEDDVDLPGFVELEVLRSRTEAVTAEAVQSSAETFLPLDRFILVSLYPEAYGQ